MTSEDLTRWIGCDQCGIAQAMYLVKLVDGELFFCGHHYNASKTGLDKVSYEVIELNKIEEDVPQLETAEQNG
jgi:hypothetical protein